MCKKCNHTHTHRPGDYSPEKYIGPKAIAGSTALALKINIGTTERPDLLWFPRSVVRIDPQTGGVYVKQWYLVRNGLSARIAPHTTTTNAGA